VNSKDFVPAAWDQNVWRGNVYALPLYIDTNFAMLWNKVKYAEAGLNPDRALQTVPEFDSASKKLTRFDSNGKPTQMAMAPWTVYGNPNTIFTWGWIFGGDFYNVKTGKATLHDDKIVKALDYLTDYWERYNDVYTELGKSIPTGYGRFTAGRDIMSFSTPSGSLTTIEKFPDMQIGIARMFHDPESGIDNPTWIGGFSLGIPTGAKNAEAAFKLIEYMTVDPEGIALWSESSSWMPANIKAPTFRKLGTDPKWRVFTDIAVSTVRYRPAIPMLEAMQNKMNEVYPKILRRQVLARPAMEEISNFVDNEMATRYK
jgi:multiple sugar transport system substrate-binding protein